MAQIDFLFQGIQTGRFHKAEISNLFQLKNIQEVRFCQSFVRSEAIELIAPDIQYPRYDSIFIAGIRNGITSAQALIKLLSIGIRVFCVDTGSPSVLFHPKLIYVKNATHVNSMIGSSNMTRKGLDQNIEASYIINLDLSNATDTQNYTYLRNSINDLMTNYGNNVFEITNGIREVITLMNQGLLIDERINLVGNSGTTSTSSPVVNRSTINSQRGTISNTQIQGVSRTRTIRNRQINQSANSYTLLWLSRPLTRRDLSIPNNPATHATGSMYWKVGQMQGIDQRHYFRDTVFQNLTWIVDQNNTHYERTNCSFEIVINGVSFGLFNLRMSHNTNTNSRTYQQHNSMTQLHWGDASSLIQNSRLLSCTLKLLQSNQNPNLYRIEIN